MQRTQRDWYTGYVLRGSGVLEVFAKAAFCKTQQLSYLLQIGGVLGEVLVIFGVQDRLIWIFGAQRHGPRPAADVVKGAVKGDEVGSAVDKDPSLGIGTGLRFSPEGTADIDDSGFIGP